MATQGINQRFNSLRVENRHANLDHILLKKKPML